MNRTEKLEEFDEIIITLKDLKNKVHSYNLDKFSNLLNELKETKTKVYPARVEEARLAFENNKSALQLSSFELMEFNFRENSHSNILAYLFDYNLIGETAIKILTEVVNLCEDENKDNLIRKIEKKQYSVKREKTTHENKRIDLFIKDDMNKFVIVIENKIFAGVTERLSIVEDEETISRTQLSDYTDFIDAQYPSYKHFYILLQLKNDEKNYKPFKKINYKQLEKILIDINDLDDAVFIDYKRLLKSLNKGITKHQKLELLQKAKALNSKKETEITLTEIEQIKTLSYE